MLKNHMVCFSRVIIAICCFVSIAILKKECHGLMLAWDPSPGACGYKLYYSTDQGDDIAIDVGNVTTYNLIGFKEKLRHYVSATSYNLFGESGNSNVIYYDVADDKECFVTFEGNYKCKDFYSGETGGDNCPNVPNKQYLGSCVDWVRYRSQDNDYITIPLGAQGHLRYSIICNSDDDCQDDQTCMMIQTDNNDNGVGDSCECYADIVGSGYNTGSPDGKVDVWDMLQMKKEFTSNMLDKADVNNDNALDAFDFLIMKYQIGKVDCPRIL